MRCRSCDAEIAEGSAFCPTCGARQEAGIQFETVDRLMDDFRRRLDERPDDADARFNLALAYKHKGLDEMALAELERLREQAPDLADVEYELAALYARRGAIAEALQAARRALAIEPDHRAAQSLLQRLQRNG